MSFNLSLLSKLCATIIFLSCISFSATSQASLVIIVHPDNPVTSLNHASLRKIFLRKIKSFPNGTLAKPAELNSGDLRNEFLKNVLKKSESSLSSYWARMLFSGKAKPPAQFKVQAGMKNYVATNIEAIGYIESDLVDNSVKVLTIY
ncbi:MAG: phosphate ABC transporter substrate-binding protein [Pseudomonadales bacterium]|nr:phosphate ABC transporter substrate-binding protein [Pseudomonadales bacterium]